MNCSTHPATNSTAAQGQSAGKIRASGANASAATIIGMPKVWVSWFQRFWWLV